MIPEYIKLKKKFAEDRNAIAFDGGYEEPKTIEALSVTENGTYSETGKAYSPVTVNVAGGGGSSDFGIAEVTVINNTADLIIGAGFACFEENEAGEGSPEMTLNILPMPAGEQVTFKVPMYKGLAYWNNPFGGLGTEAQVTGGITNDGGYFSITGDGTITIS